jgi:GNAT superfamily N-acetyltransferase
MIVREVDPADFLALAALFERDHSPCYCRYWHFAGTNKEWEARCGLAPEENKKELERSLGIGETRGIVALEGDDIIGWMKISRRGWVPKLLARSPYKNLDAPEDGDVFSIGCFLIDPAHRRRGVARAMLKEAIRIVPSWGAGYLEGYPRVFDGLHDFEHFTGPPTLYEELGFQVVRDQPQYPVLRLRLAPP